MEKIKVLPLLPPETIVEFFNFLVASLSPNCANSLLVLIDYYERQWLIRVGPEVLSICNMLRRTNNNCEALNRILRDRMGRHPTLWIFLSEIYLFINVKASKFYNYGRKIYI